jgi:hypothetical protein
MYFAVVFTLADGSLIETRELLGNDRPSTVCAVLAYFSDIPK